VVRRLESGPKNLDIDIDPGTPRIRRL
jgi:hypothetical protein